MRTTVAVAKAFWVGSLNQWCSCVIRFFISGATALNLSWKGRNCSRRRLYTVQAVWYHFPFSWKHPACSALLLLWIACEFPPIRAGRVHKSVLTFTFGHTRVIQCSNSTMLKQCHMALCGQLCWLLLAVRPYVCVMYLVPYYYISKSSFRYFYSDDIPHTEDAHVYHRVLYQGDVYFVVQHRQHERGEGTEREHTCSPGNGRFSSFCSFHANNLPAAMIIAMMVVYRCASPYCCCERCLLVPFKHTRAYVQFGNLYCCIYCCIYVCLYTPSPWKTICTRHILCTL